jgi:uncharacterized RDD family membrane protein YckC
MVPDRIELLDTTATVDTPERVQFQHRLAGPGRRGVAWGVDGMVFVIVVMGLASVLAALQGAPAIYKAGTGVFLVSVFFLQWGYGVFFETLFSGRTPGKYVMSLRVVRDDGGPARFPDYALRNLLRTADWLPFGFGFGLLVMTIDRRMRRMGDLVAGTVVVFEERAAMLARVAIDPPVTESERQSLPPKVVLSRDELTLIEAFLRRRRELSNERAEELATLFGPALSQRTGVIAPTWERVLALAYARATGKDR